MPVTGSTWQNFELFKFPSTSMHQSNPIIARICNYHTTATSQISSQKLPYMAFTDGSRTTPHWGQFLKPNDFSSGPWSLGQLTRTIPHQDHHQPVKPFVRTNICPVGNCPGGKLSGYAYRWLYVNMALLHKICVWTQIRQITRKLILNQSESCIKDLRLIFLLCVYV